MNQYKSVERWACMLGLCVSISEGVCEYVKVCEFLRGCVMICGHVRGCAKVCDGM